jgi:methyl-accepting chemotaxis protein
MKEKTMNTLKNLNMRAKLFLITIPLAVAIVVSVLLAGYKINTTEQELTNVYYGTLYQVNSKLLNADRDFYQATSSAAKVHEVNNGLIEMPEQVFNAAMADYEENRNQVLERVNGAVDIAKQDEYLYEGVQGESGMTFKQASEAFFSAFNAWDGTYNVRTNEGSWVDFMNTFDPAREYLDEMQEITEKWADEEYTTLTARNRSTIILYAIIYVIVILVLLVLVTIVLHQINTSIREVTASLDALAGGDLNHPFPEEHLIGSDELGRIHKSAKNLSEKLSEIIGETKRMSAELTTSGTELAGSAEQASQASNQVSQAIEEISQGAIGQAESVEVASQNTTDIGGDIDRINSVIDKLSDKTDTMKETCDGTVDTMEELLTQNSDVVRSMKEIHAQISATNEAVKNIAEASQIITDISSQTNLLSLNASIEAARAGESGRGFAVVATEIGNLADQSGNAAVKISQIVKDLVEESAKSVATIEAMSVSFEKQNTQINATGDDVKAMAREIAAIADETEEISKQVKSLNFSKESLVGIVSDLSAVSEENAASTQETNAAMEELNATFALINESANQLQVLAKNLNENISFFRD